MLCWRVGVQAMFLFVFVFLICPAPPRRCVHSMIFFCQGIKQGVLCSLHNMSESERVYTSCSRQIQPSGLKAHMGHVLGERRISTLLVSNLMCWQEAQSNKTKTCLLCSATSELDIIRLVIFLVVWGRVKARVRRATPAHFLNHQYECLRYEPSDQTGPYWLWGGVALGSSVIQYAAAFN